MRLIFRIAFRNLFRNMRRSAITIGSLALGLALIFWLQSILRGQNQSLIEAIASAQIGHLQISRGDFRDDRQLHQFFDVSQLGEQYRLPDGAYQSPRIYLPSLVSSGEASYPVSTIGVSPESEIKVTDLFSHLVSGNFLDNSETTECEKKELIISETMAKRLNVNLGDKIVILAAAADGTTGNELLRIKGIFNTGSTEFDNTVTFAHIECAKKIAAISGIHEIAIRLPNDDNTQNHLKAIQTYLPPNLRATSWSDILPKMATIIRFNTSMLMMISVALFIVITLGIVNNLIVGVFERSKEFGVMMALGTPPKIIVFTVLFESMLMVLIAIVLGTGLGAIGVSYHSFFGFDTTPFLGKDAMIGAFRVDPIVHPKVDLLGYFKMVFGSFLLINVAACYPAWRATRFKPIEVMSGR